MEKLKSISIIASIVSITIGILISLGEYRGTLRAEATALYTQSVENDIRLLMTFSELMDFSNGRSGYRVSESAIKHILSPEFLDKYEERKSKNKQSIPDFDDYIEEHAILTLPVGSGQQSAAISGGVELAKRHKFLIPMAISSFEDMKLSGDIGKKVERYVEDLRKINIAQEANRVAEGL